MLLYDNDISGNCYKVRLLLTQLGIPFERRQLSVFDRSNRAEVLGHRDFTPADWFFDVGGDSLLLIRVHSILTEALPDHEVTVGDLYACSAIEDLAAKLRADARRTAA